MPGSPCSRNINISGLARYLSCHVVRITNIFPPLPIFVSYSRHYFNSFFIDCSIIVFIDYICNIGTDMRKLNQALHCPKNNLHIPYIYIKPKLSRLDLLQRCILYMISGFYLHISDPETWHIYCCCIWLHLLQLWQALVFCLDQIIFGTVSKMVTGIGRMLTLASVHSQLFLSSILRYCNTRNTLLVNKL